MRGLHRCGHAELGEAAEVVGVEQLRVLDARPQPARLPSARASPRARPARRGWRASPIACTARSRPASAQRPARSRSSSALSSASPSPASANGSSIAGRARAERAVGERLDGADAQPLVAEAAAQPERDDLVEPLGRERGPDAQREAARSAFSRCQAARPCSRWKSWMPVTPRACASRMPVRDGRVELALARRGDRRGGVPGRGLAQHAGRLAGRIALDDGRAADRQPRERRRREPGRVVVVRPEQHRRGRRRRRRAPRGGAPGRRPASAPSASRRRAASRRRSAGRRPRPRARRRASASPRGRAGRAPATTRGSARGRR